MIRDSIEFARLPWLWAILSSLVLTALLMWRTEPLTSQHEKFQEVWDHHKYIHMSRNPVGQFQIAPYARRILNPALAGILSNGSEGTFRAMAFIFVALTGVCVFGFCRAAGFDAALSFGGTLCYYGLGRATKFPLYDFWLPDAMVLFFICGGIWLILRDRLFAVSAWMAVGVLCKESAIFIAPLLYSYLAAKPADMRRLVKTICATAPAVGVLILLRIWIPAGNANPDYLAGLPDMLKFVDGESARYQYLSLLREIGLPRFQHLTIREIGDFTGNVFGVLLCLLPWFGGRAAATWLLRGLPYLALVYAQLALAWDVKRLLVIGFPALLLPALAGVRKLTGRFDLEPAVFWGAAGILILLNITVPSGFQAPFAIQAAAVCVVVPLLWVAQRVIASSRGRQ